jgi:hypothetical protein
VQAFIQLMLVENFAARQMPASTSSIDRLSLNQARRRTQSGAGFWTRLPSLSVYDYWSCAIPGSRSGADRTMT